MPVVALPDRLERFLKPEFTLRSGMGTRGVNGHVDVCLLQAVSWLAGEDQGFSDAPMCVCPILKRYGIRLNDSYLFSGHRDLLKPIAPRLIGTRSTRDIERSRAFVAADYAVRVFAPIRLRIAGKEELASALESIPKITNKASSEIARDKAREIRVAADAAADAAVAAAAYAAVAADAAADAAAYAAVHADVAADAYAAVAVAAAADAAAYAAADADAAAAADAAAYADVAVHAAVATDVAADDLRSKALECFEAMISVS